MKYIILLLIPLMGCAPLSDVKERDAEIERLRAENINQKIIIDTLNLKIEKAVARYETADMWRNQWFKELSECNRNQDTLLFNMFMMESNIKGCQR